MTDIQKENKSGGKVPNLRFPGFEDAWEVKKLGDVAEKVNSGKTPLGGDAVYTNEGVLFIRSQNVNNDKLELENSVFIPESVNIQMKNSVVKPHDILLNITGASLGRSCVVPENFKIGNVNQHVCIVRLTQNYNPRFVQPILSSNKGQTIFNSLQTGSGREGLNFESIKGIKLFFPDKNEQTKIATFLSLIDERIQTQSKILLHLKSLIESLNDSLSEQKIRINSNSENWKKVRLRDLGYTFNGLSGKTKEDFGQGKKYIQYKQIFDYSTIAIENCGYVMVSENENQNNVKYGDIFFTTSSETPDEIGMSSVLLEDVKDVYLNSFCFGFRLNSFEKMLPEFARFLFRSKVVRNEIKKLAQGSTRYNMSKTELLKLEILLPSIKEQKEISAFLSSLYQKIQTEKAILEQLEMQKKYLLQQMFV